MKILNFFVLKNSKGLFSVTCNKPYLKLPSFRLLFSPWLHHLRLIFIFTILTHIYNLEYYCAYKPICAS